MLPESASMPSKGEGREGGGVPVMLFASGGRPGMLV